MVVAASLVVLAVSVPHHGGWREGLRMALDLWIAAGLLRLSTTVTWSGLASVAAIIAIRELVGLSLLRHPASRSLR